MKSRIMKQPKPEVMLDMREIRKQISDLKQDLMENETNNENIAAINKQLEELNAQISRAEREARCLKSVVRMPDGRRILVDDSVMNKLYK